MQSIECTSCIRLFCEPFCSTAGGGVLVIAVAPAMDLFGGGTVDWVCVMASPLSLGRCAPDLALGRSRQWFISLR